MMRFVSTDTYYGRTFIVPDHIQPGDGTTVLRLVFEFVRACFCFVPEKARMPGICSRWQARYGATCGAARSRRTVISSSADFSRPQRCSSSAAVAVACAGGGGVARPFAKRRNSYRSTTTFKRYTRRTCGRVVGTVIFICVST
jgi:hypothetical protein